MIRNILAMLVFGLTSLIRGLPPPSQLNLLCDHSAFETVPTMSALDAESNDTRGPTATASGDANICYSEDCIHTASHLLECMDLTTEPCDDFYQFVCGKYRKKPIPDDKEAVSPFSDISEVLKTQLRSIVDEPIKNAEPKHLINPKKLFKLCMDKERIELNGLADAKEIIKYFGGWPVVEGDKWDGGSFDWKETIYKFRSKGFSVDYLIDFSISVDLKNSTVRIIELDAGSLALSKKYFMKGLKDRVVSAYYSYMVDLAVLLGADKETAKKELMESLKFEMTLSDASLSPEERRDFEKLYNKMKLSEVQQKFPTIPWKEYFSKMVGPSVTIDQEEPVLVIEPEYITKLEKIMEQTPKRIIANYLMWRVVSSLAHYMPEQFRARTLKYYTVVAGSTERPPRWKECVGISSSSLTYAVSSLYIRRYFKKESKKMALDLVNRVREEMYKTLETVDWMDDETSISVAVSSLYIRKYFKKDSKKKALELVSRVREEFYKTLERVDWMDDETRLAALDKAKAIANYIAYPEELLDDNNLAKFYEQYDITNETSLLAAILKTTKFATNFTMNRLRQPVNKTEWLRHGSTAVVNAFYSGLENSISFPAGILQGVFFNSKRPSYMNYGGIGFVIGHEITHGFDDQGRQFDKEGNLREWWSPEIKEKFKKKAECIISQYGNYSDSQVKMNLNGINTQGENIADNGGIQQAYRAYNAWVRENSVEPRLPGLQQFSQKQMFWISAASVWCSSTRNESLSNRILTGYHSPGEFRVKGTFSNMADFAKDFNCPTGSMMNPKHKCKVW